MDYAKNLHPSSIPWNPLCLSGFQRVTGTNPPFITLHRLSFPVSKRLRVYTIVAFSFIRTFAPYFFNRINYDNKRTF